MLTRDDAAVLEWGAAIEPAEARRTGGDRWDRLRDLIRPECVRQAFEEARSAPETSSGEESRVSLRLLLAPFLAVACEASRAEFGRAAPGPDRRTLFAIGTYARDPRERATALRKFSESADRSRDLDGALREVFEAAARGAGAPGLAGILAATAPGPTADFLDDVERRGVAPLDPTVAREAAERWRRSPWRESGSRPASEWEVPFLERLGDRSPLFPAGRVRDALRGIATEFGSDPDAGGPQIVAPLSPWGFATAWEPHGGPARVAPGSHGGPGGLRDGLAALGLSLRHQVRSACGASPGSDPAFRWASAELFARIASRQRGLGRWVPPLDEAVRRDLSFEAALTPRVAWALGSGAPPESEEVGGRLMRATGRPPSPARLLVLGSLPEEPTARLRGLLLAILLEERLLLRHGYLWWESRAARGLLVDLWAAESGETPRSVASALGLGTMDPSPLADAYRP